MMAGQALGSRAVADVARRAFASEWAGPEPAAAQTPLPVEREAPRRIPIRKP